MRILFRSERSPYLYLRYFLNGKKNISAEDEHQIIPGRNSGKESWETNC